MSNQRTINEDINAFSNGIAPLHNAPVIPGSIRFSIGRARFRDDGKGILEQYVRHDNFGRSYEKPEWEDWGTVDYENPEMQAEESDYNGDIRGLTYKVPGHPDPDPDIFVVINLAAAGSPCQYAILDEELKVWKVFLPTSEDMRKFVNRNGAITIAPGPYGYLVITLPGVEVPESSSDGCNPVIRI